MPFTSKTSLTASAEDPYLWLEDVEGTEALNWVRAQNANTQGRLTQSDTFKQTESELLAVLDSDVKIPYVQKIGTHYYNFWTDATHQRGLWRRTTLDEFRKPEPKWETVLDIDALNLAEDENWVWGGADCLPPDYRHCLITLSRGGADAHVVREFDLVDKQWVKTASNYPSPRAEQAGSTWTLSTSSPTSVRAR